MTGCACVKENDVNLFTFTREVGEYNFFNSVIQNWVHTHTLYQTRFHQNCLNTLKGHFGYTYRPTKAQNLTDDARTTKRARPVCEKNQTV